MDIPPPPPPPPSPDDVPPPYGPGPGGPPPPPPAPTGPYETGSPYGAGTPYAAPQPTYGGQPSYGGNPYQHEAGPYAAPGSYGYPAQPQGWYAVERTTNGLAIASLITSFTCVPLLGAILGVAGLRQIKRRGQRGRGLAVAGVTLNSLGTVLVALVIVLAVLGVFDEGNTNVEDIKVGQCFNTVGSSLSDYGTDRGYRANTVDVVSCEKEHDAEAFAVFTLDPSLGQGSPGEDEVSTRSGRKCASYGLDYLGGTRLPEGMSLFYYMPSKQVWDRGDRGVTCFFGSRDGRVTGSVKTSGGSSDGSSGGSDDGSGGASGGGSDDSGGIGV